MLIQIEKSIASEKQIALKNDLKEMGFKVNEVQTDFNKYLVCLGKNEIDIRSIGFLEGVRDVHFVNAPYPLVSREWKVNPTQIKLGDVTIGGGSVSIMAGPCSIESEEQIDKIVNHLYENGVKIMRGGVYKPRSSPYAFRGLGIEGLKIFNAACKSKGIKIITEVMQVSQINEMLEYTDIFQVGARNSQNFNLLDSLGSCGKPVMIKRGMSGTIEELLQSAEYIFSGGNEQIMLCERGIRTFETAYRNTFDINAIQILKEKSHLPVIADPSHGVGLRAHVPAIALASVMAGADGIIYETHYEPEKAFSDAQQTLDFDESKRLINAIRKLEVIRNELNF